MTRPVLRIMATLALLGAAGQAHAQIPRSRIYSRPATPSSEVLRRLNLKLAWRQSVPMDGPKDRFLAVRMDHRDLFVITRSGLVARLDQATGRILWKTRVGKAYAIAPFLAFNSHSVYAAVTDDLYGLDRETGNVLWETVLPSGLASAMVADEDQVYVPRADGRLSAYLVPGGKLYRDIESARGSTGKPRPKESWSQISTLELAFAPILTEESILAVGPSGRARGYAAYPGPGSGSGAVYRFDTDGKVGVRPGQFDDRAYVGSENGNLYALSCYDGKLAWRYVSGSQIVRTPAAFYEDVYATSRIEGMARLDAETGRSLWAVPVGRRNSITNPAADLFLAASRQYVYARDRAGRVLVLDRKRGVTLSMVDWSAFRFPVPNTATDRLFLAANDGTILCLHDKDQRRPILHRKRINERRVIRRLREPTTERGKRDEKPLRDRLGPFGERYNLRFRFADNVPAKSRETPVKLPPVENKRVWDLLASLLKPAGLGFRADDDEVVIVPAKEQEPDPDFRAKPPVKEKEKEKEKGRPKPKGG